MLKYAIRPSRILIIDDNPTDILLTRRALGETGIPHELQVAHDGEEGLNLLSALKADQSDPPDLILLDLNMPKKDGFEVLTELRARPDIGRIPVVVLTSSTHRADVDRCYALHANSYLAKPVEYKGLKELIRTVVDYWFAACMLPE